MSAISKSPAVTSPANNVRYLTSPGRLLGTSLFLGWLFEWAFFDKALGIQVLLYVAALVVGVHGVGLFESVRSQRRNWLLGLPIVFFASMVFVRSNERLTFLNISLVVGLLMLWVYYYSAENLYTQSLSSLFLRPMFVMGHALAGGFSVLLEAKAAARDDNRDLPGLLPVLRGLLLALPIVLVFAGLLLSADMLFAQRMEAVFAIDGFATLMSRIIVALWVAWMMVGAIAYAMTRGQRLFSAEQKAKAGDETAVAKPLIKSLLSLGMVETSIILITVNLLFGAFVVFQFAYLFGGVQNITLEGFSYAEYARQGFWELMWVAILTLCMVLALKTVSRRDTLRQTLIFNGFSTLMIALVTVMLISAHQRLSLLELTFGYTFLRLQSHLFVLWLGIALAWFVVSLWLKSEKVAIGLLVCALGFVAHLNLINPDQTIVEHNWARFKLIGGDAVFDYQQLYEVEGLDLDYLASLSDDAIPALVGIQDELSRERPYIRKYFRNDSFGRDSGEPVTVLHQDSAYSWLDAELRDRRIDLAIRQLGQPWQTWHFGAANAYQLLSAKNN